jgi:hypothetical protein
VYDLLKHDFLFYVTVAVFIGGAIFSIILSIFRSTENTKNKKIKAVLRFGVSSILVCLWGWLIVSTELFPISLAYYEYNHDIVEERTGVIDIIEEEGGRQSYIYLYIDDTKYKIIDGDLSRRPIAVVGKDIEQGDTVKIKFGAKSKYIFYISRVNTG